MECREDEKLVNYLLKIDNVRAPKTVLLTVGMKWLRWSVCYCDVTVWRIKIIHATLFPSHRLLIKWQIYTKTGNELVGHLQRSQHKYIINSSNWGISIYVFTNCPLTSLISKPTDLARHTLCVCRHPYRQAWRDPLK